MGSMHDPDVTFAASQGYAQSAVSAAEYNKTFPVEQTRQVAPGVARRDVVYKTTATDALFGEGKGEGAVWGGVDPPPGFYNQPAIGTSMFPSLQLFVKTSREKVEQVNLNPHLSSEARDQSAIILNALDDTRVITHESDHVKVVRLGLLGG